MCSQSFSQIPTQGWSKMTTKTCSSLPRHPLWRAQLKATLQLGYIWAHLIDKGKLCPHWPPSQSHWNRKSYALDDHSWQWSPIPHHFIDALAMVNLTVSWLGPCKGTSMIWDPEPGHRRRCSTLIFHALDSGTQEGINTEHTDCLSKRSAYSNCLSASAWLEDFYPEQRIWRIFITYGGT